MNLIGKSTIDDFDQRHFLDCIQIHEYMNEKNNLTIDLGTGAGLPGILLSIIGYKNLHLVEKSPKKSAFLENCKLQLGLDCTIHNQPLAECIIVECTIHRSKSLCANFKNFKFY